MTPIQRAIEPQFEFVGRETNEPIADNAPVVLETGLALVAVLQLAGLSVFQWERLLASLAHESERSLKPLRSRWKIASATSHQIHIVVMTEE